jgi:peptide-methionine (S)-S-oxide reductase
MRRLSFAAAFLLAAIAGPAAAQTTPPQASATQAIATFAGGCFWCVEADFDKVPGVISTTSGHMGGTTANPTYKEVSSGRTGHAEVVQIVYDPSKVTYAKLLDVFWRNIDPLVKDRQFCDTGDMYRTAIFYHDDEQRKAAEETKKAVEDKFKPRTIFTQIVAASAFTAAEDYHQDYYLKNPDRYAFYRWNCGRDRRLEELWGKANKSS